jgi:hypothetical protein
VPPEALSIAVTREAPWHRPRYRSAKRGARICQTSRWSWAALSTQLLRRVHMTGDALELMRRRVVVISLFA